MKAKREKMTGEKRAYHAAGLAIAIMEAAGLHACYITHRVRRNGRIWTRRETVPIQQAQ